MSNNPKLPVGVNLALLSGCQLASRFIGLAVVVHLAKSLGAGGLGQVLLLTSLLQYLTAVVDFGFSKLGPVEVGRAEIPVRPLAATICLVRLVLFAGCMLLFAIIVPFLHLPAQEQAMAFIFVVSAATNAVDFRFVFMGNRWVIPPVLAEILKQLFYAGAILVLIHRPEDATTVAWIFLASRVIAVAIPFIFFLSKFGFPYPLLAWSRTKEMIAASAPMMASGGLGLIHFNFALVLTGILLNDTQCGLFGAAHRVSTALTLLAAGYFSLLSPMFARAFKQGTEKGKRALVESVKLTSILGTAAVVGGVIVAEPAIVTLLGKEYVGAVAPLQILMIAFGFSVVNKNYKTLLISTGHQVNDFKVVGIVAGITIVLGLTLIPVFGIVGASIVTAISEICMSFGFYMFAKRLIKDLPKPAYIPKLVAAATIMCAVLLLTAQLHLFARILLGGFSYLASLMLLRLAGPRELIGLLTGKQLESAVDDAADEKRNPQLVASEIG